MWDDDNAAIELIRHCRHHHGLGSGGSEANCVQLPATSALHVQ
jgi:hypothetical protein